MAAVPGPSRITVAQHEKPKRSTFSFRIFGSSLYTAGNVANPSCRIDLKRSRCDFLSALPEFLESRPAEFLHQNLKKGTIRFAILNQNNQWRMSKLVRQGC